MSYVDVRPGDIIVRTLGGAVEMRLRVTDADDNFVYVGPPGVGWKFDRVTGAEVDEELGWGPQFGVTGSYIAGVERDGSA
jgi:hypothetical protein